MSSTSHLRDYGGYPVATGNAVAAWQNGEQFMATVSTVTLDGRLVLSRNNGTTVERAPDAVEVVVPDEVTLPEAELTATIDHRLGDDRFVVRLSGRAGLCPVTAGQLPADPHTRALRGALLAVPGVGDAAVVATVNNRARNIVIYWSADADRAVAAQAAWQAARNVIDNVRLTRAFWQPETTKD